MKTALLTGIGGQDGSYLSEFLLEKDYKVYGIHRRVSTNNTSRVDHINDENFILVEGDITDAYSMSGIIGKIKPDEIYHLAAQSHVGVSFEQPLLTLQTNVLGTANILEAVRHHSPTSKVLHAGTSEQYGNNYTMKQYAYEVGSHGEDNYYVKNIQDEHTPFSARSPYGASKIAAFQLCKVYRESYNMFACSSICFNHESPRRGTEFVTRKITKWLGEFYRWQKTRVLLKDDNDYIYGVERGNALDLIGNKLAKAHGELVDMDKFPKLRLGNLETKRDFGFALDYVRAMYMMLQNDKPVDYVIATGETHSIRQFLNAAFNVLNIKDWAKYVVQDEKFYRPCEVDYLLGDASKIKKELKWEPQITFTELVEMMIKADLHA